MFLVCRLAMSTLQLMMHQPLALFVQVDMLRMLVVFLETDMFHVGMVRIVRHRLIADLMHIHLYILLLKWLQPTVLFDLNRTRDMRMILRLVDRIRDHMSDTIHYLSPSICQADNVLLKT